MKIREKIFQETSPDVRIERYTDFTSAGMEHIWNCFERNFPYPLDGFKKFIGWPNLDKKRVKIFTVNDNGNIVGFYVLMAKNMSAHHMAKKYPQLKNYNGKGIYGLCLALDKKYRNLGIGNKLKKIPYTLKGYDYVWAEHYQSLGNLSDWTKIMDHVTTILNDPKDPSEPYHVTAKKFIK